VYSSVVLIGILVLAVQYFLTHVVVFFWPLAWAAWSLGGYPRSLGTLNIYLWGTLIALNVIQSLLLRMLFELPWGSTDAATALMSFAATIAGLLVALVLLPYTLLKQSTVGAAVGLGVSAGADAIADGTSEARERVDDVRERFDDSGRGWRSPNGGWSDPAEDDSPRNRRD
jgi:hypothetical protein